ncbi:MAG: RNA 2',3'-cyclic phosphodiesterase [Clostridiales bacterium]|nr:RNA 2',3'-cyclic phosphodiesterase [Clostridiales bacterium]MCF8021430.1 RNA 2',3'-cyclic phosphodiesterase [Clostridiales bacterium]
MSKMRVFWAINLPADVKQNLYKYLKEPLQQMPVNIKWVEEQNIHLTMKFMGDIETVQLEDITSAVEDSISGMGPFNIQVKGVGCFPGLGKPRIFWAGIEGNEDLLENIYKKIQQALLFLGFDEDKKPFSPHLTLARFKSPGNCSEFMNKAISLAPGDKKLDGVKVGTIDLMQSILNKRGPTYNVIYSVKL